MPTTPLQPYFIVHSVIQMVIPMIKVMIISMSLKDHLNLKISSFSIFYLLCLMLEEKNIYIQWDH